MKHLFVPSGIALMAKENGFDEECISFYSNGVLNMSRIESFDWYIVNSEMEKQGLNYVSAPLYQQLIDWFKNQHNIMISIDVDSRKKTFAHIRTPQDRIGFWVNDQDEPLEYYAALNKAFLRAFKMIPQISK